MIVQFYALFENCQTAQTAALSRRTALKILEIHREFLRIFALPAGTSSLRWTFRQVFEAVP